MPVTPLISAVIVTPLTQAVNASLALVHSVPCVRDIPFQLPVQPARRDHVLLYPVGPLYAMCMGPVLACAPIAPC